MEVAFPGILTGECRVKWTYQPLHKGERGRTEAVLCQQKQWTKPRAAQSLCPTSVKISIEIHCLYQLEGRRVIFGICVQCVMAPLWEEAKVRTVDRLLEGESPSQLGLQSRAEATAAWLTNLDKVQHLFTPGVCRFIGVHHDPILWCPAENWRRLKLQCQAQSAHVLPVTSNTRAGPWDHSCPMVTSLVTAQAPT